MSTYSELIKSFEKIRAYMREFYVYGFKSRDGYNNKSARSYDDERRRIESYLGEHMRFTRTAEGKSVFISVDSRAIPHNPFYKAWKAKSFTDRDITLHFILFDILYSPDIKLSLSEIMDALDKKYLSEFKEPMLLDESTVRKKLSEYCGEGIIVTERLGKKAVYSRASQTDLSGVTDALSFYSEAAPCGVIGSFLLDKTDCDKELFAFKHHYITFAMDSGVLAELFTAMRRKSAVTVTNLGRKRGATRRCKIVPLRVFISAQNGRAHLLAYVPEFRCISSFRIDYLSDVVIEEPCGDFDALRARLDIMQSRMWGVSVNGANTDINNTEHVEFTVAVENGEEYIIKRLEREKRVGRIEKLKGGLYRFSADVYSSEELFPWIRTFICRITEIRFSSRALEKRFKSDLEAMYRMYGIGENI